jgi:hypothetical protein
MMVGYNIYDRFTMEHFPLCQSLILTTSFFLLATVQLLLCMDVNASSLLTILRHVLQKRQFEETV